MHIIFPAVKCISLSSLRREFIRLLALGIFLAPLEMAQATIVRDAIVEVMVRTQSTRPYITLYWPLPATTVTSQRLWRRVKGDTSWGFAVDLGTTATTYVDTAAEPGVLYEYSMARYGSVTAYGAIVAGYNVPLTEQRGKVIMLVDNSLALSLASELAQLQQDITGDGWVIIRHDVPREVIPASSTNSSDFVTRFNEQKAIRDIVKADYATDPNNNWALLIVGHIPVPYSGRFNPDGHADHLGAWPTDSYYADVVGTWTDATVDTSTNTTPVADQRDWNFPGDGKFDQSALPTDAKLVIECGRVDLSKMLQGLSETELMRQYLVRNHRFRWAIAPYDAVGRRAIMDDSFSMRYYEPFSSTAWSTFIDCFGSGAGQVDSVSSWFPTMQQAPVLMAGGFGGGSWKTAFSVGGYNTGGGTDDFAVTDSKAVFCFLFGSWFGDWDVTDDFLRAPLAGTSASLGLASVWSGRGQFHLYHMAMGETIGYGVRYTQNVNSYPGAGEWYQNGYLRYIHYGLMGDPTLRLHTVRPPLDLSATPGPGRVALTWTASADAVSGYHVYRSESFAGPFVRITGFPATGSDPMGSPIGTTSFIDSTAIVGTTYIYQVKAVKMEKTPSGSYANQSVSASVSTVPLLSADINGWRYTNFGTGQNIGNAADTATPANDGVTNIVKYVTGLSPNTTASGSDLPSVQSRQVTGVDTLTYTFTYNPSATDVTVTIEAANSPAGPWTSINPFSSSNQFSVQNDTPRIGLNTITVKDTQSLSASSTRFMRLRVARP